MSDLKELEKALFDNKESADIIMKIADEIADLIRDCCK